MKKDLSRGPFFMGVRHNTMKKLYPIILKLINEVGDKTFSPSVRRI